MNRIAILCRAAATFLFVFALGCDGLHAPVLEDGPEFDLAIPAQVVQAWSAAFEAMDYAAYEALLADEFEFFPRNEDANDFPWMPGDSWERTAELGMVANMFDPDYSGPGAPVTNITTTANLQSQVTNGVGRPELIVSLVGQVLVGPVNGYTFDTRLRIELEPVGGKYVIREVTELSPFERAISPIETNSLGFIKALFR